VVWGSDVSSGRINAPAVNAFWHILRGRERRDTRERKGMGKGKVSSIL